MAYEETAKERESRKAREESNKAQANAKQKAAIDKKLQPIREGGEEAVKGMEEGRMDAMGNAYKKGGSVSSASKRADGCCIKGKTRGKMV